jgi:hypothetical protein
VFFWIAQDISITKKKRNWQSILRKDFAQKLFLELSNNFGILYKKALENFWYRIMMVDSVRFPFPVFPVALSLRNPLFEENFGSLRDPAWFALCP